MTKLLIGYLMVWFYSILSVLIVSSISLIGLFTFAIKDKVLNKALLFMVAFSAGALIGDSFLHILPEIIEEGDGYKNYISVSLFSGILAFFILEKFLRWRHCHDIECDEHPKHLGSMNLVGDAFHNLIDGLLIGVSFAEIY